MNPSSATAIAATTDAAPSIAPAPRPLPSLLLVDDDPLIVDSLSFALRRHYALHTASERGAAIRMLETLVPSPELALIDLGLPPSPHRPNEGFALIREILARSPQTRVIALSGQSDESFARHARTLGAIDFIAKPCDPAALLDVLERARRFAVEAPNSAPGLIGDSAALRRLRTQLAQCAEQPFPVLIEGESGCGKEIVARQCLHEATRRADRPFLALNCAAIAPSLVEPTLFGHAKGAFTGASGAHAGYFEEVADGTLFLDEIGELPLDLQPKLLRVLENGEYQRVGETQTRRSRARIVAATNRDLREMVRQGGFRADLYHRLGVFTVQVPALREMDDDRFLLLDHFRACYGNAAGVPPFELDRAAEAAWAAYHFPGNVRELRNIVIRLTARYAGQTIDKVMLEAEFDPLAMTETDAPPSTLAATANDAVDWSTWARAELARRPDMNLDGTLHEIERALIAAAIEAHDGNISQAARRLGISRTTLYNRLDEKGRG